MADQRQPPRQIDAPEPGRFKVRIVKSGPWVHARIWSVMGMLQAEIGGVSCAVSDVWESGTMITDAEYFRLRDHPAEAPDARVDIRHVTTF